MAMQAVWFDFNGIIIDDEPVHFRLLQRLLGEEGIGLTQQDYVQRYLGYDDWGALVATFRTAGRPLGERKLRQLIKRKAALYRESIAEQVVIFPGVVHLIQELCRCVPLGAVSGALRSEIDLVLGHIGVAHCFEVIVSAEDVSHSKPDPEGYLLGLAELNRRRKQPIPPAHCLVIEDSLAGVQAARSAGMRCLAVTNSYRAEELFSADLVVPSLTEVTVDTLRRLFGSARESP